jgi:hypothetical protein
LRRLQGGPDDDQLLKFVALGYELWLKFQKTNYSEGCAQAAVAHLFVKYSNRSLTDLLEDSAFTRELNRSLDYFRCKSASAKDYV